MKTLLLLRHAKSVSSDANQRDVDRSLNDRGRREAQFIGKYIREHELNPDLVLSSAARRARETTELVLESAGCSIEVRYDERMYEAGASRLLEIIAEVEKDKNPVLTVGHNPGMEELLQLLTGSAEHMATGTLAKIDLKAANWCRIAEGKGSLDWLISPKGLAGS
jgi:phosphohistidine phosphatase